VGQDPRYLIVGVVAIVATLALGVLTPNRLIRSKLRTSLFLLVIYLGLLLLQLVLRGPGTEDRYASVEQLVFALAFVNLFVALLLNPFRLDKVPERFPNIVQTAITFGLFLVIGTLVMEEKFLTTSAVGAVVVGFALQDLLGNMLGGLAIQVEKPFRVGQWIAAGNSEGRVAAITWRATKLATKTGNLLVVPNAIISKEVITNYSEPHPSTRLSVDVGGPYHVPPNRVKAVILQALANESRVLQTPPPEVLIADFGGSSILYRARFWIDDFAADELIRDGVRSAIYYALRRQGIEIPLPAQVHHRAAAASSSPAERALAVQQLVASVDLLAPLSDADRMALAQSSQELLFGRGEMIVRQDQPGTSMFIVSSGSVRVIVEPSGHEVAIIAPGGHFGEMSLLTGEPRTATVVAADDSVVLEITADVFRRLVLSHPAVIEQMSEIVESRQAGLDKARAMTPGVSGQPDTPRGLLSRIREFLHV
jgi:small-conductance mechanosensitive channel/CRP-like cAMP-binding protein